MVPWPLASREFIWAREFLSDRAAINAAVSAWEHCVLAALWFMSELDSDTLSTEPWSLSLSLTHKHTHTHTQTLTDML